MLQHLKIFYITICSIADMQKLYVLR